MARGKAWTNAEHTIINKALKEDQTYGEIKDLLEEQGFKRSPEAIRKFISRSRDVKPQKSAYLVSDVYLNDKLADKYHIAIQDLMEYRDSIFKTTTEQFVKVGNPVGATQKVLTISDLHIPFINKYVIEHAIENHRDAQVLVINGDLFDNYLVSKWPKDKIILLQWEYQIAIRWIKFFAEIFPNVVLVCGNHDQRSIKHFASQIDPVASFLVSADMLDRLAQGYDFTEEGYFEQVHHLPNVHYNRGLMNWYTVQGKTVFVHPLKGFSTVPGATSLKWSKYFQDREDYQCLVMAHTHRQSHLYRKNRLLLEQGCCCLPMEYEVNGHGTMDGQIFGYATVEMDKVGNVDFDNSKTHYVGTGSPVKIDDPLRFLK